MARSSETWFSLVLELDDLAIARLILKELEDYDRLQITTAERLLLFVNVIDAVRKHQLGKDSGDIGDYVLQAERDEAARNKAALYTIASNKDDENPLVRIARRAIYNTEQQADNLGMKEQG